MTKYLAKLYFSLLLFTLTFWGASQGLKPSYAPLEGDRVLEQALLEATNNARLQAGLLPLEYDEKLALAARQHATEMARLDYLSHSSPLPENASLTQRVAQAGSSARSLAENIAFLSSSSNVAQESIQGWLNSPGHRRNLLEPSFTHVGFGVAQNEQGNSYVVQVFAGQPLVLQGASVASELQERYEAQVRISLHSAQQIALFYGESGSFIKELAAGTYTLHVRLPGQGALQLRLAVQAANGGNSYILQDEAWLEPVSGTWRQGHRAPAAHTRIEAVSVQPQTVKVYRVNLVFSEPLPAGLGVWINDKYQRHASASGQLLSLELLDSSNPALIEIGLKQEDGRYRIIHGLTVRWTAGVARLYPGLP